MLSEINKIASLEGLIEDINYDLLDAQIEVLAEIANRSDQVKVREAIWGIINILDEIIEVKADHGIKGLLNDKRGLATNFYKEEEEMEYEEDEYEDEEEEDEE